jgi:hypothetical protein
MDDPHEDEPTLEMPAVGADDDEGPIYDRVWLGSADQTHTLRLGLRAYLRGCPVADEAVLIASEFAANAIIHSNSRNCFFICRAEVHSDHVRVEVEDLGGQWICRPVDDHPHGLQIVQVLSGGRWGTEVRERDGMRLTWAEVSIPKDA